MGGAAGKGEWAQLCGMIERWVPGNGERGSWRRVDV